jgi:DNA-binding transcriptional ArsR family regulator
MADQAAKVQAVFHALADPTRRSILEKLTAGPVSVSQLAIPLDMTLAAVVQHLQILEESGLVSTQKVGRVRTCQLNPRGIAIAAAWLDQRKTPWEQRFDRLGAFLGEKSPSKKY